MFSWSARFAPSPASRPPRTALSVFDPDADVGVVALANGNWRTVKGQFALYLIMERLFEAATRLG